MVVTFDLERFEWAAPDRLQVAGTFAGLGEEPARTPTLVLYGDKRAHRLPAVAGAEPPADGEPWMATFAWREAPEAFESAELQLGEDVSIDLPEPGAGEHHLEVRHAEARDERSENGFVPAAERLRLQGDLLAAEEEAREARALADRAMEELSRAHQDLDAERERHAADAERFREGLATVRASAEEALAAEQETVGQLRAELEAAEGARTDALATVAALQERLETLEQANEEHERLRAEVELARVQVEAAKSRRDDTRAQLGGAREDVERLLERLKTLHDALDEAG